jgi:hypothetical protein
LVVALRESTTAQLFSIIEKRLEEQGVAISCSGSSLTVLKLDANTGRVTAAACCDGSGGCGKHSKEFAEKFISEFKDKTVKLPRYTGGWQAGCILRLHWTKEYKEMYTDLKAEDLIVVD